MFENIDLSLVISCAALFFSFFSPLINSIVSGCFRIKEKKLDAAAELRRCQHDFYDLRKADTISRYLSAAGVFCKNGHLGNMDLFGSSFAEIYLYVDSSLWPIIDQINSQIYFNASNREQTANLLSDLSKALSAELRYYQPQPNHAVK